MRGLCRHHRSSWDPRQLPSFLPCLRCLHRGGHSACMALKRHRPHTPLLHDKDSAQFLDGQAACEADGHAWKQDGAQECTQKYFNPGSHWHLGAGCHLLLQDSKLANPACRWIDIWTFFKSWEELLCWGHHKILYMFSIKRQLKSVVWGAKIFAT